MEIQFSTTEKYRALEYLKKVYPNYNVNEENAREIIDLVGIKIRIGDPFMYGNQIPIYPIGIYTMGEFKPIYDRFISSLSKIIPIKND